jgi:hypothetical protein
MPLTLRRVRHYVPNASPWARGPQEICCFIRAESIIVHFFRLDNRNNLLIFARPLA